MKVVSEKNIAPFLTDVDNIKMQKVSVLQYQVLLLSILCMDKSSHSTNKKRIQRDEDIFCEY